VSDLSDRHKAKLPLIKTWIWEPDAKSIFSHAAARRNVWSSKIVADAGAVKLFEPIPRGAERLTLRRRVIERISIGSD
jgi:hypothetical protein